MEAPLDKLPSSFRALGRSLKLGHRAEPALLLVAALTTVGAAVPDALFALGLAKLTDAVLDRDGGLILFIAGGLALLATGSWVLTVVGERLSRRLADRASVQIESHVASLHANVATIEHHERRQYADRLSMLRNDASALSELFQSLFLTSGAILRLVITLALLMTVHPALALLGVFAVPTILVSNWRASIETAAHEAGGQHERRARHLFLLGATAPPGKEVRVAGVKQLLRNGREDAWQRRYGPLARARWASAVWQSVGLALFGSAFILAIAYVVTVMDASAGSVVLVITAGSRLSQYIGQTVETMHFFRTKWLDCSRRMVWLEDFAKAKTTTADLPAPDHIRHGVRLENVTFRYPGTERLVLEDVTLDIPAGKVIAIVGENGAGKSSLIKLLCRLYEPTVGRITIDGIDLARIPPAEWRSRLAGAFQDYFPFEFRAQQSIGLGDLERIDDRSAVSEAVSRAGAADVIARLDQGLDTQLGVTWNEGTDLSQGQWQKIALARGFMRTAPLLLILDEPTSALDVETEHALFERYAAAARSSSGTTSGTVTILVSHRFSTVQMADLIVVVDAARVIEHGSHHELIAAGGQYADLYHIQANAYR